MPLIDADNRKINRHMIAVLQAHFCDCNTFTDSPNQNDDIW